MIVDTENLISITEASQNFSRVARLVDERGSVVILKNNVPRYLVVDFRQAETTRSGEALDVSIHITGKKDAAGKANFAMIYPFPGVSR